MSVPAKKAGIFPKWRRMAEIERRGEVNRQQGIQDLDPFDGWDGRFETEAPNKDMG